MLVDVEEDDDDTFVDEVVEEKVVVVVIELKDDDDKEIVVTELEDGKEDVFEIKLEEGAEEDEDTDSKELEVNVGLVDDEGTTVTTSVSPGRGSTAGKDGRATGASC